MIFRSLKANNPLDWTQINKGLLLAFIVCLYPISGIIILSAINLNAPGFISPGFYEFFIVLDVLHLTTIIGFILVGLVLRKYQDTWAWIEHAVIISYLANVIISSYLFGIYLTYGLIYIAMGIAIISVLGDVVKIRYSVIYLYILIVIISVLDFGFELIPHAPAISRSLYEPNGDPLRAWQLIQICLLLYTLAPFYLLIISVMRWIEREQLYKKMSMEDSLTGLINRRTFLSRARSEVSRMKRDPQPGETDHIGCIMIDLDHFKRVNDSHGHAAGDRVLIHVAKIMSDQLREHDLVGRFGGEEFAILTPGLSHRQLMEVADQIRGALERSSVWFGGEQIQITASFGIAVGHLDSADVDVDRLIKLADVALYEAKRQGRNQVVSSQSLSQSLV